MGLKTLDPTVVENEIIYQLGRDVPDAVVETLSRPPLRVLDTNPVYVGGVDNIYGMRPWVGKRAEQTVKGRRVSLRVSKFENSLIIEGEERRGRHFQLIDDKISDLQLLARYHWRELLIALIVAGDATANDLDSQYFFDTDHVTEASGTQSNDLTYEVANADPGLPTIAEASAAMTQAAYALLGFKDNTGRVIQRGTKSFLHLVPLHLAHVFGAAATMPVILNGSVAVNNTINVGGVTHRVEVLEGLSSSFDGFYTFIEGGRPFIRAQQLIDGNELQVSSVTDPNDHWVFENDAHKYGVMAIRGAAYFRWFDAVLTTLTT